MFKHRIRRHGLYSNAVAWWKLLGLWLLDVAWPLEQFIHCDGCRIVVSRRLRTPNAPGTFSVAGDTPLGPWVTKTGGYHMVCVYDQKSNGARFCALCDRETRSGDSHPLVRDLDPQSIKMLNYRWNPPFPWFIYKADPYVGP